MLVIFYSRGLFPARQAAVRYLGEPTAQWQVDRLRQEEFWPAGEDDQGRRICALGGVSRPDVVYRVFHGMTDLFGLAHAELLLQPVGSAVAWADMGSALLRKVGLNGAAERLEERAVAQSWPEAERAVAKVASKIRPAHEGNR